jgi:hypothetical protein
MMHKEYAVEIQRTITTTLRISAESPQEAVLIADDPECELPSQEDWDSTGYWRYTARDATGKVLYAGNAQDLQQERENRERSQENGA